MEEMPGCVTGSDENAQRAHSPQLAAGLASELQLQKGPFLTFGRFPAACCRELQFRNK